jgi:exonuclease III
MDDLIKAAKENNMDIIALQEIRKEGVGKDDITSQEFTLFWSGGEQGKDHEFGTGFLVSSRSPLLSQSVDISVDCG